MYGPDQVTLLLFNKGRYLLLWLFLTCTNFQNIIVFIFINIFSSSCGEKSLCVECLYIFLLMRLVFGQISLIYINALNLSFSFKVYWKFKSEFVSKFHFHHYLSCHIFYFIALNPSTLLNLYFTSFGQKLSTIVR